MCKISVIIPFFNPPIESFKKCINSVFNQDFKDYEVIFIDDGSEEFYLGIIDNLAKKFSDYKVYRQVNSGVSAARNKGIDMSSGDYLSFVDSDDWIDGSFLDQMYENIKGHELAICNVTPGNFHIYDADFTIEEFCGNPKNNSGVEFINFCANKIFSSKIIKENQLSFDDDISLGEDALFLDKYLEYCKHIKCISEALYHYEINDTSAVIKFNPKFWNMERVVVERQLQRMEYYSTENKEYYLQSWLYKKLKNAVDYYINGLGYINSIKYLKEIYISDIFQDMLLRDYEGNDILPRKAKCVLWLWQILGVAGIVLARIGIDIVNFF